MPKRRKLTEKPTQAESAWVGIRRKLARDIRRICTGSVQHKALSLALIATDKFAPGQNVPLHRL